MKVFVTPNAIDPEKYSVKTKREKIREKYGLTNKIVIGFAGGLIGGTGLILLLIFKRC
jgi:hypothetical protein